MLPLEPQELFEQALQLDPERRRRFLDEVSTAAPDVAEQLRKLLEADALHPDFLDGGVESVLAEWIGRGQEIGQRVGDYEIVETLGSGGMGVVCLARRVGDFDQLVAMKFARWGCTADELARLAREREILARLRHPGIAQLYGGGDLAGRPYLVMEYVEGVPITEYCEARELAIDERLDLIRSVCEAVHFAHQNLIVHRDIKPSNILVTSEGQPKLLDFGIAKLIVRGSDGVHGDPAATVAAYTPAYSSPEQLRNEPITTATDVFSLGVLSYEVVAGEHPFPQARRGVGAPSGRSDVDPTNPARTPAGRARGVEADLGNVLLRALSNDPGRRYDSSLAFADDIGRYLRGHPVEAQPPSAAYRLSKYVRKHRVGVAAVAASVLAMAGGLGLTSWQARVAQHRAAEAIAANERAERVNAFLQGVLATANPSWYVDGAVRGPDVSVLEALEAAATRMETELADDPEVRADVHHTLGDTYRALYRHEEMVRHFNASLALRRQIYEAPHPKVAEAMFYSAAALNRAGEWTSAAELLREAVAMQKERDEGNNLPFMLQSLSTFAHSIGDHDEAVALQSEAARIFRSRFGPDHAYFLSVRGADARLVEELAHAGRLEESRSRLERLERAVTSDGEDELPAEVHTAAGVLLAAEGRFDEAEDRLRAALRSGGNQARGQLRLAQDVYLRAGRFEQAREAVSRAIELFGAEVGGRPVARQEMLRAEAVLVYIDAREGGAEGAGDRIAALERELRSEIAPEDAEYFWRTEQRLRAASGHLLLHSGDIEAAQALFHANVEGLLERGVVGAPLEEARAALTVFVASDGLPNAVGIDDAIGLGARRGGGS